MSMSRKEYQAIANSLATKQPSLKIYRAYSTVDPDKEWQYMYDNWLWIVNDLADTFAELNPKFNKARFIAACHVGKIDN